MQVSLLSDAQMGHWLRRYRQRHGLTQGQLAEALGRTQASVSLLEHGERRLLATELLALIRAEQVTPPASQNTPGHLDPERNWAGSFPSSHEGAIA